jgi:hypothetical protein
MNDNYSAPSGGAIYAGMAAPSGELPYIAEAGTFVKSAADSFVGFAVLSIAPLSQYVPRPHGGSSWDATRKIMWVWGDETHGNAAVFRNSPWFFNPLTGKLRQCAADDPLADYNVDGQGYQWANPAQNRPWAAHGYRAMYYNPDTKELEIYVDVQQHSYVWPSNEINVTNRKSPIYYFNTETYQWRVEWSNAIDTWNKATFTHASTYVKDRGYYSVTANGIRKLSLDKQSITYNVVSTTGRYHNYLHVYENLLINFGGGIDSKTGLCSVHNLDNVTDSQLHLVSSYTALDGYSIGNMWSVNMQNGKILFAASNNSTNEHYAFIFDIVTRTVVNTGYKYLPSLVGTGYYYLKAEWDNELKCAYVFYSQRYNVDTIIIGVKV